MLFIIIKGKEINLLRNLAKEQEVDGKMKKVAIVQSNYISCKGDLDMINMVDEFIL